MNAQRILYHVSKLLYAKEESEDVAQEIALQIYTSIAKLKEPDAFSAWMYRIIINTCKRHNRDNRGKSHGDIDEYRETLAEDNPEAQPAEAAESGELSRSILQILDSLPERQRMVLFLYYYEDMAYDAIASVLGISIGSVGSYISRGKNVLMKKINKGKIGYKPEALSDAELGAVLFSAFESDIMNKAPIEGIEAFVRGSMEQIANLDAVSGSQTVSHIHDAVTGAVAGKAVPFIVASVAAAAATTGFVSVIITQSHHVVETPPPVTAPLDPYVPVADIKLYDAEGRVSRVNPVDARLTVNEGEPVSWSVTDASDAIVATGAGVELGADTFALPPGDYAIQWIVRNDKGQSVTVWSEFEIIDVSEVSGIEAFDATSPASPIEENPEAENPVTETPETAVPETETPATDTPATTAPATEAPAVTEAPATTAPATEAPAVTEAPATTAPAAEAPAVETPKATAPKTGNPVTTTSETTAPEAEAPTTTNSGTTAPETESPPASASAVSSPESPATTISATTTSTM
jgi:RNA polymerase sigma factor (sigma-70 family)